MSPSGSRRALLGRLVALTSGQVLIVVLSGLLSVLIARLTGPEVKGGVTLILTTVDVLAVLFSFGAPYALAYYARARLLPATLVGGISLVTGILSAALAITALAATASLGRLSPFPELALPSVSLTLFFGAVLSMTLYTMLGGVLVALGAARAYALATNAGVVVNIALVTWWLGARQSPVSSIVAAQAVANLFGAALMFRALGAQTRLEPAASGSVTAREFALYGLKAHLGQLSTLLFKRIDLYVVGGWLGAGAVGLYSVGLSLRDLAMTVARNLSALIGGEMSDDRHRRSGYAATVFRQGVIASVAVASIVTLVSWVVLPWAVPLVFGSQFASAAGPAKIVMLSLLPMSVFLFVGRALYANATPLAASVSTLAGLSIAPVCSWWLVSRDGVHGAAMAHVINSVVLLTFSAVALRMTSR